MESYLNSDIIQSILRFLDKTSSFSFLNTANFMIQHRSQLYDKYYFYDNRVNNEPQNSHSSNSFAPSFNKEDQLRTKIKHLICANIQSIHFHTNLSSLEIFCSSFDKPLINLPRTLQRLTISHCYQFNSSINDLPETLQSLTIFNCWAFNQPLDHLPNNLQSLKLCFCNSFNQPFDNLPNLKTLKLSSCNEFNHPITHLHEKIKSIMIHKIIKI